jgi:outer membrane protein OmpA-like peptidoglycan-associated protein
MTSFSRVFLAICTLFGCCLVSQGHAITPVASSNVYFGECSTEIPQRSESATKVAAHLFDISVDPAVQVRAHTDGWEARACGLDLSPKRGEAVKRRLIELGIPAERIEVLAYRDSDPMVCRPGERAPPNRYVEIVLTPPVTARLLAPVLGPCDVRR